MFPKHPGTNHTPPSHHDCFACPHCGQKLEICPACQKRLTNPEAGASVAKISPRYIQNTSGNPVSITVCDGRDPEGTIFRYERYETVVPLSVIDHHSRYKEACKACRYHGTNLACPPFSPTFQDYTEGRESAEILCLRLPLAYFSEAPPEERSRLCFQKIQGFLVEELSLSRTAGYTIAGAGPCIACDPCVGNQGTSECPRPDERIFSLESLGVNLLSLSERCFDITLEWNSASHTAHFVCAMGATFYHGDAA